MQSIQLLQKSSDWPFEVAFTQIRRFSIFLRPMFTNPVDHNFLLTKLSLSHPSIPHNSLCPLSASKSGIVIIFTTRLVHPVKCWVRWPWPVSGLYCSHAKPVRSHSEKTLFTRFCLSDVYKFEARSLCGEGEVVVAISWISY